jgi:protein transport protein SEC61 subunit gamma and related proteins
MGIKSFAKQSIRVWHLLKKPSGKEFSTISKVGAIGLALVGVIGFIISIIMDLFGFS